MRLFLSGFFLIICSLAHCAELLSVTWPTNSGAPPVQLESNASQLLPAFRLALTTLPEASIVSLALSQPPLLGLTPAQAATLQPLTAQRYRLMAESALYSQAPSALPYCFSSEKPKNGLATVYVPSGATSATPVIIFLHGYGGSYLWYQHYLSEVFPDHIIICPAYGISSAFIPQKYVSEAITAVSKHLTFQVSSPSLIGLSAGGFGACRIYVQTQHFYSRLICLAALPPDDTVFRFIPQAVPRFLSGGNEPFVIAGDFHRQINVIRRSCPGAEEATIPGADHFFLLTHPVQTIEFLRRWLSTQSKANLTEQTSTGS